MANYMILGIFLVITLIGNIRAAPVPEATLNCTTSSLSLAFNETQLRERANNRPIKIAFNVNYTAPQFVNCSLSVSNTSDGVVKLEAKYDECGITVTNNPFELLYNAKVIVTYGTNPSNALVFRENTDSYNLVCRKLSSVNATIEGIISADNATETNKTAAGKYDITLTRRSADYLNLESSANAKLGDTISFKIEFTRPRSDIKMYTQTCFAVSTKLSNGVNDLHTLMDNRCPVDTTFVYADKAATDTEFYFSVEAFKYFTTNTIYLTCTVKICSSTQDGSGACNSVGSSCGNRRRRGVSELAGTVGVEEKTEFQVQSPIIILLDPNVKAKETKTQAPTSSSSILDGTNGTILIALIAIIVVLGAVAVIKKLMFSNRQAVAVVSMKDVAGYDNNGMA